jgi:hypothetical protein
MSSLNTLVGEWRMEASVRGKVLARGTTSFGWVEDGAFLVQRSDGQPVADAPQEWETNSPFPVVVYIGRDDPTESFCYAYADARGVHRVYQMKLNDKRWEISGQAGPEFFQRFSAKLSGDGRKIAAYWEKSRDGHTWERDFDLSYTRLH